MTIKSDIGCHIFPFFCHVHIIIWVFFPTMVIYVTIYHLSVGEHVDNCVFFLQQGLYMLPQIPFVPFQYHWHLFQQN